MQANPNFYSTSPDAILMEMLRSKILAQNPALLPISAGLQAAAHQASTSRLLSMANSMPSPLLPSLVPPQQFFERYVEKPVRQKSYQPPEVLPAPPKPSKAVETIPQKISKPPPNKEQPVKTRNPTRPIVETFSEKDLEITRLRSEISKIQSEHEAEKQRSDRNLSTLLTKNTQYCSALKKSEEDLQTLQLKLSRVLKQNHKISSDYEQVAREKNEYKKKVNDLLLEKSQLEMKYSVEVSNMRSSFQKTKLENEGMNSGFNAKNRELEAMKNLFSITNSDLIKLTAEKKTLDKVLAERDNEIAELKGKCENLDHLLFTQVSTYQIETMEFHTKIKNLEQNVGKLGTQLVLEKLENKKLQQENCQLKTRKIELETRLEDHASVAEGIKMSCQKENLEIKKENEKEMAILKKERDLKLQKLADELTTLKGEMGELIQAKFNLNFKLKKRHTMGHQFLPENGEKSEYKNKIKRKLPSENDYNCEINDEKSIQVKLIKSDCKSDKDSSPDFSSGLGEEDENCESTTTSSQSPSQFEIITLSDEED